MVKKWFDWTQRDIAYWEKIRKIGLGNFILIYGVGITGGLFFVMGGLFISIEWLRQMGGSPISMPQIILLLVQLVFIAAVSLVAGLINSLVTWVVENRLYRGYKVQG